MHGCYETRKEKYKDKVWTVESESWDLCVQRLCGLKGTSEDLLRNICEEG